MFLDDSGVAIFVDRHCAFLLRPLELGDGVAIGFPLGCSRKVLDNDGDEFPGIMRPVELCLRGVSCRIFDRILGGVSRTTTILTGG